MKNLFLLARIIPKVCIKTQLNLDCTSVIVGRASEWSECKCFSAASGCNADVAKQGQERAHESGIQLCLQQQLVINYINTENPQL